MASGWVTEFSERDKIQSIIGPSSSWPLYSAKASTVSETSIERDGGAWWGQDTDQRAALCGNSFKVKETALCLDALKWPIFIQRTFPSLSCTEQNQRSEEAQRAEQLQDAEEEKDDSNEEENKDSLIDDDEEKEDVGDEDEVEEEEEEDSLAVGVDEERNDTQEDVGPDETEEAAPEQPRSAGTEVAGDTLRQRKSPSADRDHQPNESIS